MNQHPEFSPAERDQLAQELLELHFGCHEDPSALQARLANEPALQALQQEVLRQARVLEAAVQPTIEPLPLPAQPPMPQTDAPRRAAPQTLRWLRSPFGRLGTLATLAAAVLLTGVVLAFTASREHARFQREHLHLTVTAPRAVPGGAPWSFTAETRDLAGNPVDGELRWQAFAANGTLLAQQTTATQHGKLVATLAAHTDLQAPARLVVTAATATDEVTHLLPLATQAAGPLMHVTTDRAVYRPGEPLYARAVVLDRVTRLPLDKQPPMRARLVDANGTPVAFDQDPQPLGGASAFAIPLPANGPSGPLTLEVDAADGSLPIERCEIVVRSFQPPQLQKKVVLDRSSYAPGARGAATVTALRLATGNTGASGASATAMLVIDGTEVWREKRVLGALGEATFAFVVPKDIAQGAARFVATIDDGGIVETEVKPFVVPTGKVLVGFFPEGGELVAGVDNRVYVECTDPLGRAIDTTGDLLDDRDRQIAKFHTAHQGRGIVAFVPKAGTSYRLRLTGQAEPFALPAAQERGLALQLRGDEVAAAAPVRLSLAGRGAGPWLVGVFCRGVLVAQTTVRADGNGELRADVELPLPPHVAGVLRATVFDRTLQPVAERLLRRASAQYLAIAITARNQDLSPGERQQLTVQTNDETGRGRAALVGLSVTDDAVNALASEPRIGLVDHAQLFADVDRGLEKLEAFGDFFLGADGATAHADLLLGTRGWRRFVWRNDANAQATLTARGPRAAELLEREGFAQVPQVASNLAGAAAKGAALADAATMADERVRSWAGWALALLVIALGLEGLAVFVRRSPQWWIPTLVGSTALVALLALLMPQLSESSLPPPGSALVDQLISGNFAKAGTWTAIDDFDVVTAQAAAVPFRLPAEAIQARLGRFAGALADDWGDGSLRAFYFLGMQAWDVRLPVAASPDTGLLAEELVEEVELVRRLRAIELRDWDTVRQSRQYAHQHTPTDERRDFTPTIFWNAFVATDSTGQATVDFATSDAVTTWRVHADAHTVSDTGRLGQANTTFGTRLPVQVEAKLPDEVAAGDRLQLPVNVVVRDTTATEVSLTANVGPGLRLAGNAPTTIALREGRGRVLLPIDVLDQPGRTTVRLAVRHGRFEDRLERTVAIAPRGFPHRRSHGGTLVPGTPSDVTLAVPDQFVPNTGRATLRLFPTPLSTLTAGLEGMLQEPHGCFEQTSSTNYPNTLVLQLLDEGGDCVPTVALRARDLLAKGYARLVGFECKRGGFEWFGGDPGHEALTAYGLLQFHDMAQVFDVDAAMVARTRRWLLGRRNGRGDFVHEGTDHHAFGRSQLLTNAYCVYALLQSGGAAKELSVELDALLARGRSSDDAYELALIANALQLAGHADAAAVRQRLAERQKPDGSLCGTTTSITQSSGRDLAVETTGLAALAWLADPAFAGRTRQAIEFLQSCRSANGTFGATQATVCAMRALVAYTRSARPMRAAGTLRVHRGDSLLAERAFSADATEPLTVELWSMLEPGPQTLRLDVVREGAAEPDAASPTMPWALDVAYHAELPADDPDAPLVLRTALRSRSVAEGEPVALDVTLENGTGDDAATPIVRLGLPAGCELPTRVLEDLQRSGQFDHWELQGRDLVLYWRQLPARSERTFVLDLVARVPGTSSGAASRAWPYYAPTRHRWAAPLQLEIRAN